MASFNLGYIKGPKGDSGPKGDKGEKGDKGDTGTRGTDGITPVFTVKNVLTVDNSETANVEIDSSDVANPKLTFYIPSGENGKDALGDMAESVYDTEGKRTDIYKFARTLFEACVKKSGGNLQGELKAFPSGIEKNCVRNICLTPVLPEEAENGDLCIITAGDNITKLSEHEVGSIVILKEGNADVPYILVAKDYHSSGTATLIRRDVTDVSECFDSDNRGEYSGSDVDFYLSSLFLQLFSEKTTRDIVITDLGNGVSRKCFIPSRKELSGMEYFLTNSCIAHKADSTSGTTYITRDSESRQNVYAIGYDGEETIKKKTENYALRPILVFSGDTSVENTLYDGKAAVTLAVENQGICFYENGQWKEIKL